MADQLGRSVGDMYQTAFFAWFGFDWCMPVIFSWCHRPSQKWVPAPPVETRNLRRSEW